MQKGLRELCRKILLEVEKCHDLPLDVYPISIDWLWHKGSKLAISTEEYLLERAERWFTRSEQILGVQ